MEPGDVISCSSHASRWILFYYGTGLPVWCIGGDPGGDGGDVSPPRIFLGGIVPPSIFESLKNIYS